jgi:hypothetical protein
MEAALPLPRRSRKCAAMAQDDAIDASVEVADRPRSFWRRWIVFPFLLIFGLAFLALWLQREDIADDVIGSTLESYGIPATYEVERIGGRRQVLTNIVIGDPARPDLTIERAEVVIRYRFGYPGIAGIRLERPRLYGTFYGGALSFGALDPLIFPEVEPEEPFEFPDMTLALVDARALLESEYGPVGIKAEGSGHLRGGFAGRLAATAPELAIGACEASGTTLYGAIGIDAERPRSRARCGSPRSIAARARCGSPRRRSTPASGSTATSRASRPRSPARCATPASPRVRPRRSGSMPRRRSAAAC